MKPLDFLSGLILAGAVGAAVHWRAKALRAQDAVMYMVEDGIEDDADEALRLWLEE